jgi:hypothetical protein
MGKDNQNEDIDKDIEQSREDVLRARDIIPSSEEKNFPQPETSGHKAAEKEQNSEIPSFDLSAHITNKHRRQASSSRKPPSQNRSTVATNPEKQVQTRLNAISVSAPEQKIIRQIVARDIAKWYKR